MPKCVFVYWYTAGSTSLFVCFSPFISVWLFTGFCLSLTVSLCAFPTSNHITALFPD